MEIYIFSSRINKANYMNLLHHVCNHGCIKHHVRRAAPSSWKKSPQEQRAAHKYSAPKALRAKSIKVISNDTVEGSAARLTMCNLITHNAIARFSLKYLSVMNLNSTESQLVVSSSLTLPYLISL